MSTNIRAIVAGRSGAAPCSGLDNATDEKRTASSATRSLRPGAAGIFTLNRNLAAARRGVEPALRLFICRRARAPWRNLALAPVPHPGIDQTEQRAAPDLERYGRMQQQSAQGSALADRSIAVRPRPPTSQRQFAGILNDDNVASRRARGGARGRVTYHLAAGHGAIAQEAREPHLLGATSGEPPDLTAGPLDKRSVESAPLFPGAGRRTGPAQIPSSWLPQRITDPPRESVLRMSGNRDVCIRQAAAGRGESDYVVGPGSSQFKIDQKMSYRPARFLAFTARLTTFNGHCPVSTRRTSAGAPA